jgi:hypothetical protein
LEKNEFMGYYIASFLGARAAQLYEGNLDPNWRWANRQPVEDGKFLAEGAWDSVQKHLGHALFETTGGAGTAATGKDSTPIT